MASMIPSCRRQWVVLEPGMVGWIFGDGWRRRVALRFMEGGFMSIMAVLEHSELLCILLYSKE